MQRKLIDALPFLAGDTSARRWVNLQEDLLRAPNAVDAYPSGLMIGYPSKNGCLKTASMPICCSNGASSGARVSCYYHTLRFLSYFPCDSADTGTEAMIPLASGTKIWLLFGSDHGGERVSLLCNLVGKCKLNGLEQESYARYVLNVIMTGWSIG